jgi:hypothetical protein
MIFGVADSFSIGVADLQQIVPQIRSELLWQQSDDILSDDSNGSDKLRIAADLEL